MNIIILGPQGSGKGTQAQLLAQRFGFFYFEAGGFLREVSKANPEVDEKVNKKGVLLEDREMFSLVVGYLESKRVFSNILFDGYPRSILQYELLRDWLTTKNEKIDLAILIDISEEESIRRLSARRIDKNTGQIYNLITNPPPPDVDLDSLIQREDDKEEAIRRRLTDYRKVTLSLIQKLEAEGIIKTIDGERPVEEIFQDLTKLISTLND